MNNSHICRRGNKRILIQVSRFERRMEHGKYFFTDNIYEILKVFNEWNIDVFFTKFNIKRIVRYVHDKILNLSSPSVLRKYYLNTPTAIWSEANG